MSLGFMSHGDFRKWWCVAVLIGPEDRAGEAGQKDCSLRRMGGIAQNRGS